MVLQRQNVILVKVHAILNLGQGEWQIVFSSFLQGLQLGVEVDQLIRLVLYVISLVSSCSVAGI